MLRKILVVLVLAASFSGAAHAAYSPHWQNPFHVEEYGEASTTIVVMSPYDENYDNVTISVEGHLSEHIEISDKEFVLASPESDSYKRVTLTVDSGNHTAGQEFDGTIRIRHQAWSEDGGTGVETVDTVRMGVRVVDGGIIRIPGAGAVDGGLLFTGSGILALGGVVALIYRYREEILSEEEYEEGEIEWE